jgi:hypothetical protein
LTHAAPLPPPFNVLASELTYTGELADRVKNIDPTPFPPREVWDRYPFSARLISAGLAAAVISASDLMRNGFLPEALQEYRIERQNILDASAAHTNSASDT